MGYERKSSYKYGENSDPHHGRSSQAQGRHQTDRGQSSKSHSSSKHLPDRRQSAYPHSHGKHLPNHTPPDRTSSGANIYTVQGAHRDMARSVVLALEVPRQFRSGRQEQAPRKQDGQAKREGQRKEDRDLQRRDERDPRPEKEERPHERSVTPQRESYQPTQQPSPDVHHRRKRKLELAMEEDEDDGDNDYVPLTKSIKSARVAKRNLARELVRVDRSPSRSVERDVSEEEQQPPVSKNEQSPTPVEQPPPKEPIPTPEGKQSEPLHVADGGPVKELSPGADGGLVEKQQEVSPSTEQGPIVIIDDEAHEDEGALAEPNLPAEEGSLAEPFPPVPTEMLLLMDGDLEHVLGPSILPGADLWKVVTVNHGGQAKQMRLPCGFSEREMTEKECSLLLLAWEDCGLFTAGNNDGGGDTVYRQYHPVFDLLPQTLTLADDFRCGPLRGLAAKAAMGFLFVDVARRVGLLSSAFDGDAFLQCDEDLKILEGAGYDMGVIRKAFKHNCGLYSQYCTHELGQLAAAIQTAGMRRIIGDPGTTNRPQGLTFPYPCETDEKQLREAREMELRERKALLDTRIAALTTEVWQIEQQLAQELAGATFDLFAGLTKAEMEECLSRRQRDKEALEQLMSNWEEKA